MTGFRVEYFTSQVICEAQINPSLDSALKCNHEILKFRFVNVRKEHGRGRGPNGGCCRLHGMVLAALVGGRGGFGCPLREGPIVTGFGRQAVSADENRVSREAYPRSRQVTLEPVASYWRHWASV